MPSADVDFKETTRDVYETSFEWNIPDYSMNQNYTKQIILQEGLELVVEITAGARMMLTFVASNADHVKNKFFKAVVVTKKGGAIAVFDEVLLETKKPYNIAPGVFLLPTSLHQCCEGTELGLLCEVTIKDETEEASIADAPIVQDLEALFEKKDDDGGFADTKLNINGKAVNAHKAILAARCPLLLESFDEHRMSITPDVSDSAIDNFLHYLYTGKMPKEESLMDFRKISQHFTLSGEKENGGHRPQEQTESTKENASNEPDKTESSTLKSAENVADANVEPEVESQAVESDEKKQSKVNVSEASTIDGAMISDSLILNVSVEDPEDDPQDPVSVDDLSGANLLVNRAPSSTVNESKAAAESFHLTNSKPETSSSIDSAEIAADEAFTGACPLADAEKRTKLSIGSVSPGEELAISPVKVEAERNEGLANEPTEACQSGDDLVETVVKAETDEASETAGLAIEPTEASQSGDDSVGSEVEAEMDGKSKTERHTRLPAKKNHGKSKNGKKKHRSKKH